jgi:fructose-1,6-bisphosphatase I
MNKPLGVTVIRHIVDSQRLHPEATGDLSGLLNELIVAGKTISAEVNMAGLADILGMSGKTNIQGEKVQKLDEFANNTIKKRMARCGYLCVMTSEEEDDIIPVEEGYEGKYRHHFFSTPTPVERRTGQQGGSAAKGKRPGGGRLYPLRLQHHDGFYHR